MNVKIGMTQAQIAKLMLLVKQEADAAGTLQQVLSMQDINRDQVIGCLIDMIVTQGQHLRLLREVLLDV